MDQFDVVVIGGGPGGYVAAIRAAQLGFKVACIDEWKNAKGKPALGGTCTNVGCIPSKALLQSSEHYDHALHHFAEHGITVKGASMDVAKMLTRKDTVVKQNNDGILYLFKKNKVTFFHGRGAFAGAAKDGVYQIDVTGSSTTSITAKHVIIATGSNARALPGAAFDEQLILSNDGALRIGDVPKKLGVIGAGVIGLEMGSVWRRLGSDVTVLEGLPVFLGAVDEQVAKEAMKLFTKQGLKISLGVKVGTVKAGKNNVTVEYTTADGKEATFVEPHTCCVGVEADGVRHTTDRDDQLVEHGGFGFAVGCRVLNGHVIFARLYRTDFDTKADLQALLGEELHRFLRDLLIHCAEEYRQTFEHRYVGAEATPD